MRADLPIAVPESLAAYLGARLAARDEGAAPCPRAVIETAMTRFADLPPALCCAHVSEWSMYYFAALIAPTITLAVCAGRVPPATIDDLGCVLDPAGRVTGFVPREDRTIPEPRFEPLVEGHLAIMIARCSRLSGLATRVLWSNAAVIVDYVVGELRCIDPACPAALHEAEALLAGDRFPPLARPYRCGTRRTRKVCCLRFRLPGADICPGICPREPSTHPNGTTRRADA